MPDGRISQVRFEALAFLPWVFPTWRGFKRWPACTPASAVAPQPRSIAASTFVPALCLAAARSDGAAKYPEPLCPVSIRPLTGETCTVSCEDITPRSSLLRAHSPIPSDSSCLRPWPRATSLCRLLPAPAVSGIFPTLSLRIFPRMLGPMPRRSHKLLMPVTSSVSSAFPWAAEDWLPASTRETTFSRKSFSRLQTFLYVQASEFARLPGCSYRCAYGHRAAEAFRSGQNVLRCLHTHRTC